MKRIILGFTFFVILVFMARTVFTSEGIFLQLRLYKGVKVSKNGVNNNLNSYYLKKIADDYIIPNFEFSKEQNAIIKIYNLKYAHFLYKIEIILKKGSEEKWIQEIVLNKRKMHIQVHNIINRSDRFKVQILNKEKTEKPLLETEIIIPEEKTAVLGFEDSEDRIYFLALNRKKDQAYQDTDLVKSVEVPKLTHWVTPTYPGEALTKGIDGIVVLECHTDREGHVNKVHAIAGAAELIKASKNAVLKWKYSPWKINGISEPVRYHLVVIFDIRGKRKESKKQREKRMSDLYKKQKPLLKKWKIEYPVSEENKSITEVILVEG